MQAQQHPTPQPTVIPHGGTVQPAVNLDHLELSRIQRLVRRVQNEHELEFDPTIVSYVAHRLEVEPMSIEEVDGNVGVVVGSRCTINRFRATHV